jgi:hypothetical protein
MGEQLTRSTVEQAMIGRRHAAPGQQVPLNSSPGKVVKHLIGHGGGTALQDQSSSMSARSKLLTPQYLILRPRIRRQCQLLGGTVAVHLGGIDQAHAKVQTEPQRRDLLCARSPQSPLPTVRRHASRGGWHPRFGLKLGPAR